jgi:hypothetical protein
MNPRPTPGPWRAVLNDYGSLPTNHYLAIYGADESCVAYALCRKAHWERGSDRDHPVEANALLMAASWEMLEALKFLREVTSGYIGEAFAQIDALIVKAEGRVTTRAIGSER